MRLLLMVSLQDKERKDAKFFTEIRAGLTTFFTMAYVIAVNVSTCITSLTDTTDQRSRPLSLKLEGLVYVRILLTPHAPQTPHTVLARWVICQPRLQKRALY